MTLKEQIEATIKAYELACLPENLNYDYCFNNNLEKGICMFCELNSFYELKNEILDLNNIVFICRTPSNLMFNLCDNEKNLIYIHNFRIKFLKDLLKTIKPLTNNP